MTSEQIHIDANGVTCLGCDKRCHIPAGRPWAATTVQNCPVSKLADEMVQIAGDISRSLDPDANIGVTELGESSED